MGAERFGAREPAENLIEAIQPKTESLVLPNEQGREFQLKFKFEHCGTEAVLSAMPAVDKQLQ
jgi:hypothetical protein